MPSCNTTDFPVCKPTGSPTWGTHRSEDRNLASIKHTFIEVAQWKRGGPISTFCFFDRGRRSAAGDASLHRGRDATYELRFARVPLGRGPPTATREAIHFYFSVFDSRNLKRAPHLPSAQEVGWPDGHRSTVRGIAMATPLQHDGTALRRLYIPHRRGHVVHGESPTPWIRPLFSTQRTPPLLSLRRPNSPSIHRSTGI